MPRVISLDFETPYGKDFSVVDLGYDRYARDERCVPYMVSVCDGSEVWAGHPNEFNFNSLAGADLISHNSAFDEEISLGAAERGLFTVPGLSRWNMNHWLCSLNMSSYLWNVRSLKDACDVGLGINISKGVRDRAKDKSVEDMKREGWYGDMVKYAKEDAINCWRLWDKHNAKWPAFERRLSRLTIDQGRHGVRIDVEALEFGIVQLQKIIFTATANLPWIARGRLPGSPLGIAEECRMVGIPPPPVKAHNPEAAAEWEEEYAPRFKFVMALRNLRKAKKTLATLETIKLRLRPDQTVAFSLKYAGAGTLRWAGDSGWNLQNINKEPLLIDADFSFLFDKAAIKPRVEEFDSQHSGHRAKGQLKDGTTFFDVRGLIIARPGMKLAPVDESQIEPRVLNQLAGNFELLRLVKAGVAIYEAHARATMEWTGGDLKTENRKLYALAKARVLGLGYGCGWKKFIQLAAIAGVDITENDKEHALQASVDKKIYRRWRTGNEDQPWQYDAEAVQAYGMPGLTGESGKIPGEECVFINKTRQEGGKPVTSIVASPVYGSQSRATVKDFRDSNPLITALWALLQSPLVSSDGHDLEVVGPHGESRIYRNVKSVFRPEVDEETGRKYKKLHYTYDESTFRRSRLYGGLLVENLVQWVARMVFAERMLDLHDRLREDNSSQGVLFSVHDEAVAEIKIPADEEVARKTIEEVFSIPPAWMPAIPLAAECKIRDRYFK